MPNTIPLQINIAGTDRTTSIPHDTISLEQSLQDGTTATTTSARFSILDGGGMSLDVMQVVQFANPNDANDLYFEGYIQSITETEHRGGVVLDYDITCVDYSHDTGHAEALIDSTYAATSDSSIIATELATATPNLDVTTFVDTLDASIENLTFSNLTAREMLHQLAKLVGATWYVDPQKRLHWFDGEQTAPMILTDAPTASEATVDPEAQGWGSPRHGTITFGGQSTRLVPYRELTMQKDAPEATQAKVIGGGTTTSTVSGTQVGGRHMITKVEDPQIVTTAQADQLGAQVLEDTDDSPTYRMIIDEPGAIAGQRVRLINALRSIDDYFMINRVVTTWHPSGHIEAALEIGKHKPTFVEQISDLAKAVSGGSKGGTSTGRPEGTANRNHKHTGQADSPRIPKEGLDTDVVYWDKITDGTNTATADVASDTLTFTEDVAIDLTVSEDDTLTIKMDGEIKASSDPATGTLTANTSVPWPTGDAPKIKFISDDSSVLIKGDAANNEIDFAVSSSVGNAFGEIRLNTDGGTLLAEADTTHDLLTLVEGDNITITTEDAGDHTIKIAASAFTGAAVAWTTINGDTGTATADTATDTLDILGGTGITTTAAEGAPTNETLTIAVDSTVARNAFTTISAPSGTAPVADSSTDTLFLTVAAGSNLTVTGDSGTDTIDWDWTGVTVEDGGVSVGTQPILNFIDGDGISLDLVDDGTEIDITINSTGAALAYKGIDTDVGNVVAITSGSTLDIFGGVGIQTTGTNRADTADGITTDEISIALDATITAYGSASASGTPADNTAVAWGSGSSPTIKLISSDDTLNIKGDNTNKEIDLTVSSLIGTLAWTTILTDTAPNVVADNVTDTLGIFGGTGITVTGYDGASADEAEETTFGTPLFGEARFGDVGTLDYITIEIDGTQVAQTAWTIVTGDTGTGTADTTTDTISFTGGTGIITTVTDDPEDVSIAIDTTVVAQNAFTTVAGDSGTSATADTPTDTITIVGGTGIDTVAGNDPETITISIDSTVGLLAFTTIAADSGISATADTTTDTLTIIGGTGIDTVSANDPESITVAIDSTVATAAFTTIIVPTGTNPVATTPAETLTIAEGVAIDILGSATDTITFAMDGTIEGVAWPAGDAPNIDLTSTGSTVTISTGVSSINFEVTASGLPYAAPALTLGTSNIEGVADTVIRTDATILAFDATAPADIGAAAVVGVATVAARRDHVHQGVHSVSANSGTDVYADVNFVDGTGINITQLAQDFTFALDDTENTRLAFKTVTGDTGTASAEVVDDSLAIVGGTGITTTVTDVANADQVSIAIDATGLPYAAPALTYSTSNVEGVADTVMRTDATLAIFDATNPAAIAGTAVVGVAGVAARRDHVHVGVGTISANGGTDAVGDVNFVDGTGVNITKSGQNFTVAVDATETTVNAFKTITNATGGGTLAAAEKVDDTLTFSSVDGSVTFSTSVDDTIDFSATAGLTNAYDKITDGVTTATASSNDTIKFRSSDGTLTVAVGSNDVTHGDNVNLIITTPYFDRIATDGDTVVPESIETVTFTGDRGITVTGNDITDRVVFNMPAGTSTHTLRFDGSDWVTSSALTNDATDITATGDVIIAGLIKIGNDGDVSQVEAEGMIRHSGSQFEVRDSTGYQTLWHDGNVSSTDGTVSITETGDTVDFSVTTALPTGTDTQMLYNNSGTWTATSNAQHNGATSSIGSLVDPAADTVLGIGGSLSAATTYGVYLSSETTNTGGSSKHHELYIKSEIDTGAGNKWDEHYSIYIADVNKSSGDDTDGIGYGLYIQDVSAGASTNFAIYNAGDKPVFSAGDFILDSDTKQVVLRPTSSPTVGNVRDSPELVLTGRYNLSGTSADFRAQWSVDMQTTAPTGRLILGMPDGSFPSKNIWEIDEHGRQVAIGVGAAPMHLQDSGPWNDYNIHVGFGYDADSNNDTWGIAIAHDGTALASQAGGNLVGLHVGSSDPPPTGMGGSTYEVVKGIVIREVTSGLNSSAESYGLQIYDVTNSNNASAWAIKTGAGLVEFNDNVGINTSATSTYGLDMVGAFRSINTSSTNTKLSTLANTSYIVLSSFKSTTGDPTGEEGQFVINSFDQTIKIYVSGAWRTIHSWV